MKNFNSSIREKEQKILNFYKTIRELSGNCKLAKTAVRKRTKKNTTYLITGKTQDKTQDGGGDSNIDADANVDADVGDIGNQVDSLSGGSSSCVHKKLDIFSSNADNHGNNFDGVDGVDTRKDNHNFVVWD